MDPCDTTLLLALAFPVKYREALKASPSRDTTTHLAQF